MNNVKKVDYSLMFLLFLFACISFISLYMAYSIGITNQNYAFKQIIFYGLSFLIFLAAAYTDLDIIKNVSIYIYLLSLIMLFGILVLPESISPEINGAKGWYRLGSSGAFSIQPAEIMKAGYIVFTAYILVKHEYEEGSLKNELFLLLKMFLALLPIIVGLMLFPDLGSLLAHFAIFLFMLIASKIRLSTIFLFVLSVPTVILTAFLIAYNISDEFFFTQIVDRLPDYLANRFYGWLKPEQYLAQGYQLVQSLLSIGSGTYSGYRFTENLPVVPYAYSESIFSVIGLRYGFIGSSIVILLYFLLIWKIVGVSLRYQDDFGKYIGIGVIGMIFYHVFQNIGMSIGLVPITGIGLPFISYGGSALIISMLCMGLIMNMNLHTKEYMFDNKIE